jgi:hypothetical protein
MVEPKEGILPRKSDPRPSFALLLATGLVCGMVFIGFVASASLVQKDFNP